jgi:predicted CoA-binding protein
MADTNLADIRNLLRSAHTIAVVGISDKPDRASHGVAKYLQRQGYKIIPVNPALKEVLGEKAYARLEDVPDKINVVDIFRRPEHVPEIVDSAIAVGAKAVWMQDGVIHEEAAAKARAAGLFVVMDRCMYRDHLELMQWSN